MALEWIEALKRDIKAREEDLAFLKDTLRRAAGMQPSVAPGVLTIEGKLIRKPTTTWKPADAIERLLEGGAKTMKRVALVNVLVDQQLVGGKDDQKRRQYAELAIDTGISEGYLKEDRDTTIHWIPEARKSRVSKRR